MTETIEGPRLRSLAPGDTTTIGSIFAGLSPNSRYLRFHGATSRLPAAWLRVLSGVDGWNHVAVIAEIAGKSGRREPIGAARFVRTGPSEADIAAEGPVGAFPVGIGVQYGPRGADRFGRQVQFSRYAVRVESMASDPKPAEISTARNFETTARDVALPRLRQALTPDSVGQHLTGHRPVSSHSDVRTIRPCLPASDRGPKCRWARKSPSSPRSGWYSSIHRDPIWTSGAWRSSRRERHAQTAGCRRGRAR